MDKCETWWNSDKHYLKDEKYKIDILLGSTYNEFFARFMNLAKLLNIVVSFQIKKIKETAIRERVKSLVLEMSNYGMPVLTAKVLCGYYTSYQDYLSDIKIALISQSDSIQTEALNSTIYSTLESEYVKDRSFIPNLVNVLCIPLEWRIIGLFSKVLNTLTTLINKGNINYLLFENSICSSFQYILTNNIKIEKDISFGQYLAIKRSMVRLAASLFYRYKDDNSPMPSVILECKRIAENEEEFGDIRKSWYDYLK